MATFPGAVLTFTTKADGAGNKVFASHINTIQDEVTAIEDVLLNASAPLNLSSVTMVSLDVSGASTLTTLHVTGGSTLTELFVTVSPPAVRAYATTRTQLPDNTRTVVSLDADQFISTSAMHSTGSNPSRVIAPSSGVYQIIGHALFNQSSGQRIVELLVNSTTVIAQDLRSVGAATDQAGVVLPTFWLFQASEFVELRVLQNSGSTGSLSSGYGASLSMVKIR